MTGGKIFIFGKTINIANAKLEEVFELENSNNNVATYKKGVRNNVLCTKDGFIIESVSINSSCIGGRCMIAWIDKNIEHDIVENIIIPMALSRNSCFYY